MYILQEKFCPFKGTVQLASFLFHVQMSVPDTMCVAAIWSTEDKTHESGTLLEQSAVNL